MTLMLSVSQERTLPVFPYGPPLRKIAILTLLKSSKSYDTPGWVMLSDPA